MKHGDTNMDAAKSLVVFLFWAIVLFGIAIGIAIKCVYDKVDHAATQTIQEISHVAANADPPPAPFGALADASNKTQSRPSVRRHHHHHQ